MRIGQVLLDVLRVQHEDVVNDLEANVRRILDFCGLEFEPQCVEFHKTVRSVRTASSSRFVSPSTVRGSSSGRTSSRGSRPSLLRSRCAGPLSKRMTWRQTGAKRPLLLR